MVKGGCSGPGGRDTASNDDAVRNEAGSGDFEVGRDYPTYKGRRSKTEKRPFEVERKPEKN